MPSQPTAAAPGRGTSSTDAVAAAIAQAKREKRAAAAAAAMAPRMQSQVQKWAKMTAELGGRDGGGDLTGYQARHGGSGSGSDGEGAGHEDDNDNDNDDDRTRPKKRTKISGTASDARLKVKKTKATSKQTQLEKEALVPYAKQLRAPHRRDRHISFGVGRGLGKAADKTSTDTSTKAIPPTCLLCLARFESRQQLRDHESLSVQHKRRLRDGPARKAAFQRFAKVEAQTKIPEGAETEETKETEEKDNDNDSTPVRPPFHIKRIPRRRGDLAPTYTSYAAVAFASRDTSGTATADDRVGYHACLLCRRRFRSLATLRLHERESALHRARTRVPELVAAAVAAVKEAAKEAAVPGARNPEKIDSGEASEPNARPLLKMRPSQTKGTNQYRDRARERRQAFGSRQAGPLKDKNNNSKDPDDAPSGTATSAANKGAALLSKMGWSAGQGLGAQGGGLTEAIAPSAYRVGVGLGAQGGKMGDAAEVAARRTEADGGGRAGSSYADFVEQAQEAARQRYKELSRAEAEAAAAAAATETAVADTAGEPMEED